VTTPEDRPKAEADDGSVHDAFGHDDYARAAAEILVDREAPLTLGLFGSWGMGKTWIIDRIQHHVGDQAAFAYFDVWRYEGDALRRQFLRDLSNQLHPREADFDPNTELEDLDSSTATKVDSFRGLNLRALGEIALKALPAAALIYLFLRLVGPDSLLDEYGRLRDVVISAGLALALFVVAPVSRLFHVREQVITRSRLEDPEHFAERFGALLARLKKARLIVAIDNLDRCSPDRVEELLATIKTYLEPLAAPPTVPLLRRLFTRQTNRVAVFLIAADDDALRRHLVAKERAGDSGREIKEVNQYVDEYLRKFFSSSIRIQPLLDDDVRSYTSRELEPFFSEHGLDAGTRIALVEMVAAALSSTPRRVKQFGTNLDGRVRVIRERQASGNIEPPISDNVLMIAKLAILEEEWPVSFQTLQHHPRYLEEWQRDVVEGKENTSCPDWADGAFRRFLSISREVRASNVDAYIRLKQSRDEILLPRYDDFRTAVVQGDPSQVSSVLDAEPERSEAYAQRLLSILDEELSSRYLDGARSIVEVATSVEALARHQAHMLAVLRRAAGDSELRPRLAEVRPEALMSAVRHLGEADRTRLLAPFTDLSRFADSDPRLTAVLDGFASIVESLPEQTRASLRNSLNIEPVSERHGAMVELAEADWRLIPFSVVDAALAALTDSPSAEAAQFKLVKGFLRPIPEHQEAAGTYVAAMATLIVNEQASSDPDATPEETAARVTVVSRALDELPELTESATSTFDTALDVPLSSWHPPAWPAVIHAMSAIRRPSPSPVLERLMGEFFAGDGAAAIDYARERGADSDVPEREFLLQQLGDAAIGEASLRVKAVDAIAVVDPADVSLALQGLAKTLIERAYFRTAGHLVVHHSSRLDDAVPSLIDGALERIARPLSANETALALGFFGSVVHDMSESQLSALEDFARAGILNDDPETREAATKGVSRLLSQPDFSSRAKPLTAAAFADLKDDKTPDRSTLGFVASNFAELTGSEKTAFVTLLARLVGDPSTREVAMPALANLPDLAAAHREPLVEALVAAEVLTTDLETRVSLLEIADRLARTRGSARDVYRKRLADLEAGEGDDLTVHERLSPSPTSTEDTGGDAPAGDEEDAPS
jgi:hypothetical protein